MNDLLGYAKCLLCYGVGLALIVAAAIVMGGGAFIVVKAAMLLAGMK